MAFLDIILAKKDVNEVPELATRMLYATSSELGTSSPFFALQIIHFTSVEERSFIGSVMTARQNDIFLFEQGQSWEVSPENG